MTKDPVIVPMADGTQYLIQPRSSKRGEPQHRVYRLVTPSKFSRASTHVRVTDEGELAKVAARFASMASESKKDLKRQRLFGRRLVYIWRWIMVFKDQFQSRRKGTSAKS